MQNYLFDDLQKQLSPELFAIQMASEAKKQEREKSDLCFLFTAGETTGFSGYRFLVTREDAMKFCSDPRSKGMRYGSKWAYFFLTLSHAFECTEKIELKDIIDNGSFDYLIKELNISIIPKTKWRDLLTPFGFEII